ncbi:MAG: type II secretion system F family protein [Polyangiaceae bacterium]
MILKWASLAAVIASLFIGGWAAVVDSQGPVMRYWSRYCAFLERKLRLMFIWTPGRHIAFGQMGAVFAILAAHMAYRVEGWWVLILVALLGPAQYIERLRRQRVERIEDQLDGFLTALANALKATPSIANAFQSVQPLLPQPIQGEVDLACKEMRVGSTLDQALLNMGARVASRQLDSALSAVLIGRQLGGDMPRILETTANTLREMMRLEGVVQSKTAEGKAQAWVLAVFPFAIVVILSWMQPGFFDPLRDTLIGWILSGIAGVLWLISLLWARKILAVDI